MPKRGTFKTMEQYAQDITDSDRLQAVLHPKILPENLLHDLACDFAEHTVEIFERRSLVVPELKSYLTAPRWALDVKRRWIKKLTPDDELAAANAAAWEAAQAAGTAGFAASSAAWAAWAATTVKDNAAWIAAWEAARATAFDAAWEEKNWHDEWCAARKDEEQFQINLVAARLGRESKKSL